MTRLVWTRGVRWVPASVMLLPVAVWNLTSHSHGEHRSLTLNFRHSAFSLSPTDDFHDWHFQTSTSPLQTLPILHHHPGTISLHPISCSSFRQAETHTFPKLSFLFIQAPLGWAAFPWAGTFIACVVFPQRESSHLFVSQHFSQFQTFFRLSLGTCDMGTPGTWEGYHWLFTSCPFNLSVPFPVRTLFSQLLGPWDHFDLHWAVLLPHARLQTGSPSNSSLMFLPSLEISPFSHNFLGTLKQTFSAREGLLSGFFPILLNHPHTTAFLFDHPYPATALPSLIWRKEDSSRTDIILGFHLIQGPSTPCSRNHWADWAVWLPTQFLKIPRLNSGFELGVQHFMHFVLCSHRIELSMYTFLINSSRNFRVSISSSPCLFVWQTFWFLLQGLVLRLDLGSRTLINPSGHQPEKDSPGGFTPASLVRPSGFHFFPGSQTDQTQSPQNSVF